MFMKKNVLWSKHDLYPFVLVNNQQKHTLKIVDLTCFYYDHEYIQKQHNQIF